jgi:hypothetical protein
MLRRFLRPLRWVSFLAPWLIALGVTLALFLPSFAQRGKRVPPGIAEEATHPPQIEAPMQPRTPRVDPVKLHKDAKELADLADSVPSDIEQVNRGTLPKELLDKLKRIEKLSKQLRGELMP